MTATTTPTPADESLLRAIVQLDPRSARAKKVVAVVTIGIPTLGLAAAIYWAATGRATVLDYVLFGVFYAIHNDRQRLEKPDEIAAFVEKNGVDKAKFLEVFNSFAVQTKAKQATRLADAYKIDGVPALGINGRFFTSGTLAGSMDKALQVADYLIPTQRKA